MNIAEELKELRDKLDDAQREARSSGARQVIAIVQERLTNIAGELTRNAGMIARAIQGTRVSYLNRADRLELSALLPRLTGYQIKGGL
jgi:hypothetical protein